MNSNQLGAEIDKAIEDKGEYRLVIEWRGYWSRQKVAYEARPHGNPKVAGIVYSINALATDGLSASFDYSQNKNYDSREKFISAILRRMRQVER